ncbi:MAG: capsule biosynthesis protein [Lautropia sp.]
MTERTVAATRGTAAAAAGVVPSGVVPSGVVPSGVVPSGVAPSSLAPSDDTLAEAPRSMIDRGLAGFRNRRVLMLQGPIGPFFSRLARDLAESGAHVVKVNFNGGDRLFTARRAFEAVVDYRGTMANWPDTFARLLLQHRIDTILLFGDCRPVHVPAIALAKQAGVEVGVFEEGYLRPDYITIERDGVNHHSPMPKDPEFYRRAVVAEPPHTWPLGSTFGAAARWGVLYYCAASLGRPWYRHHLHHRPLGWSECRHWIRSGWRKLRYRLAERPIEPRFLGADPVRFFLVALQTSGDAQVRVHSSFQTVERFIEHVMRNFAAHAPAATELVIKHHPLDRGFTDHRRLIAMLAAELGLAGRCHYIHDQHLPTLLRKTVGVVTINSTVGLSAVGEGVPVAVCGNAIYDIPGLTFQGPLAAFWTDAQDHRPDFALWRSFRNMLITTTQFNGSFYKRLPQAPNASGVFWSKREQADVGGDPTLPLLTLRPLLPAKVAAAPERSKPAAVPPRAATTFPTAAPAVSPGISPAVSPAVSPATAIAPAATIATATTLYRVAEPPAATAAMVGVHHRHRPSDRGRTT